MQSMVHVTFVDMTREYRYLPMQRVMEPIYAHAEGDGASRWAVDQPKMAVDVVGPQMIEQVSSFRMVGWLTIRAQLGQHTVTS